MIQKLRRTNLWSLEQYAQERPVFRQQMIAHKKNRRLVLGDHASLYFEDFLTMKYQVQEMLRAERIYEPGEILEEIETYNPLIPDGHNWKATFMIEYADAQVRQQALTRMAGIEAKVWVQINGFEKVYAIANEDLERSTDEKSAAVHFLRFELTDTMIGAVKRSTAISFGIDHSELPYIVERLDAQLQSSLIADLET